MQFTSSDSSYCICQFHIFSLPMELRKLLPYEMSFVHVLRKMMIRILQIQKRPFNYNLFTNICIEQLPSNLTCTNLGLFVDHYQAGEGSILAQFMKSVPSVSGTGLSLALLHQPHPTCSFLLSVGSQAQILDYFGLKF